MSPEENDLNLHNILTIVTSKVTQHLPGFTLGQGCWFIPSYVTLLVIWGQYKQSALMIVWLTPRVSLGNYYRGRADELMIDVVTSFATICDETQSCHGAESDVLIIAETVVTMMTMVWLVSPSWAELSCHQGKTRPTITVRNCYLTQQHARARTCPKIIIFWQSGCRIVFAVSFLGRMLLTMSAMPSL